jgi:hypothetical protein
MGAGMGTKPGNGSSGNESSRAAFDAARRFLERWPEVTDTALAEVDLGALTEEKASAFASELVQRLARELAAGVRRPDDLLDECTALMERLAAGSGPEPDAVLAAWRALVGPGVSPPMLAAGARALGWMAARSGEQALVSGLSQPGAVDTPLVTAAQAELEVLKRSPELAFEGPRVSAILESLRPEVNQDDSVSDVLEALRPVDPGIDRDSDDDWTVSRGLEDFLAESDPGWTAQPELGPGPEVLVEVAPDRGGTGDDAGTPLPDQLAEQGPREASGVGGPSLVLSGDDAAPDAPGQPEPSAEPAPERAFNVVLEDHERDEPLRVGVRYTLAFSIDEQVLDDALAGGWIPKRLLDPEGATSKLTVQVDTDDFRVSEPTRPLTVPPTGSSLNKARFDIVPLKEGHGTLTATLHRDGNFIHQLKVVLPVGDQAAAPVESESKGRVLAAVQVHRRRDLGIILEPSGDEFEIRVIGYSTGHASLSITAAELAVKVANARDEYMKVVEYREGNLLPFQNGLDISPTAEAFALRTMAQAGAFLFSELFTNYAGGADGRMIGETLRGMAADPRNQLDLQIVSERAPLPWPALYVGDASDGAQLDWDLFLGMRHVVERIPFQNGLPSLDCEIPSDQPHLAVSLTLNTAIDQQMRMPVVARQQNWWTQTRAARPRLDVVQRSSRDDVLAALRAPDNADQVFYLYCHATSRGLSDPGGPDASFIKLSDGRLDLRSLKMNAPVSTQLRGSPLVFINACESAELSPGFYDGFVPYFMLKGARGVIGTECKIPALFAEAWAGAFFDRLLDGQPLGETVLELRRTFLAERRNPLGLLYAVHCDSDTVVTPALARQDGSSTRRASDAPAPRP